MDNTKTWTHSMPVGGDRYNGRRKEERYFVHPEKTNNEVCFCSNRADAKWIASRLNLAAEIEQMIYDFAHGKVDEEEIKKYVSEGLSNAYFMSLIEKKESCE